MNNITVKQSQVHALRRENKLILQEWCCPKHKTRIDDGFVCNLRLFFTQKKFLMQIHETQTYLLPHPVFYFAKS